MKFYLIALAAVVLAVPQPQVLDKGLLDEDLLSANVDLLVGSISDLTENL
jgi:hypothetical protein